MSLLHDIQSNIVQEGGHLGSILLKLRLLAARLGSSHLEEWVKYESEGYPREIQVPSYRIVGVSYRGSFSGPFGAGINNAPIPCHLIEKYAGKQWTQYEVREGIAAIDELLKVSEDGEGSLGLNASNLILILQGKVYPQYACNDIQGTISRSAFAELQYAVRNRILELTLELEKTIPAAKDIAFGSTEPMDRLTSEKVSQITQHIFYGSVMNISSGASSNINVAIYEKDKAAFIDYLVRGGIEENDATELADIVATEQPGSTEEPLGKKAKAWLIKNLKKAADGTWSAGVSAATKAVTEAALKYYGLS